MGKTTTIGKLAHQFKQAGKSVVWGRPIPSGQRPWTKLILWGERVDVPVISHGMNTDPASVAFDTVKKAVEMKADVVIVDTAGPLHTKVNLMNELTKIKRVMQKFIPRRHMRSCLVLDGSTGQNAFIQGPKNLPKPTEISALAITKLDGTAKGGVGHRHFRSIQDSGKVHWGRREDDRFAGFLTGGNLWIRFSRKK